MVLAGHTPSCHSEDSPIEARAPADGKLHAFRVGKFVSALLESISQHHRKAMLHCTRLTYVYSIGTVMNMLISSKFTLVITIDVLLLPHVPSSCQNMNTVFAFAF